MGPDEIGTIDRATDRKDPEELAGIAARTFVAIRARNLQPATDQKWRAERDKKGIPVGTCLKCRGSIGPEVLSINPNAPYCQPCNLASLARTNAVPQMRVAALATKR